MADQAVVTAAIVSGIIGTFSALVSIGITALVSRDNAREQRRLDQKLSGEKANAEIELAQRRFRLEIKLADWKRKTELADIVLASFYNLQFIIDEVRAPFVGVAEMTPMEGVDDSVATKSDYAPVRRLGQYKSFFSEFHARRNTFAVLFGSDTTKYFDDALRIRNRIYYAVEHLLKWPNWERDNFAEWQKTSRIAFDHHDENDPIRPAVDEIVKAVEDVCRSGVEKAAKIA